MQILKEDIRNDINLAALNLFSEKGYSKVSMRMIAKKSYVSVGNIYRYYENKNNLFESLIEDTYKNLIEVFDFSSIDNSSSEEFVKETIADLIRNFILLYNQDKKRVRILLYGSEGSDMVSVVETIDTIVKNEIYKIIKSRNKLDINAEYLSAILTKSLLYNSMEVVEHFDDDEDKITHINELVKLYINNYLH